MLTEWTRRETRLKGRSLIVKRERSGMYTDLWWASICTNIVWIHNFNLWKVEEECSNSVFFFFSRNLGEFRRKVPLLYKVTRVQYYSIEFIRLHFSNMTLLAYSLFASEMLDTFIHLKERSLQENSFAWLPIYIFSEFIVKVWVKMLFLHYFFFFKTY